MMAKITTALQSLSYTIEHAFLNRFPIKSDFQRDDRCKGRTNQHRYMWVRTKYCDANSHNEHQASK